MRHTALVVVGAGPGGAAAAVQCRRLGCTPLVLDSCGRAGGLIANAWRIENYPGLEGPLAGTVFAKRLQGLLDGFGLRVEAATVGSIRHTAGGYELATSSGPLLAQAVIVAAGTSPTPAGIPGEAELLGRGVFYAPQEIDMRAVQPQRVLVIGSGEAACDYALSMVQAGAAVVLAARGDRLKARGRLRELVLAEPRIELEFETCCLGLQAGEKVAAVLRTGPAGQPRRSGFGAVLLAVGRHGNLPALLEGGPAGPPGAIACGLPGLFCAGDARLGSLGQAGIAVGDGLAAAHAAVSYLDSL